MPAKTPPVFTFSREGFGIYIEIHPLLGRIRLLKKKPRLFSRDSLCFFHYHETVVQPFSLHSRSFTNSFVCNFLSSSAGFILCSRFFRLTLAFYFRFLASLGLPFHGLMPLSFRFLTSAVFASFRPLQFWIPNTQSLLQIYSFFSSKYNCILQTELNILSKVNARLLCSSPAFFTYI